MNVNLFMTVLRIQQTLILLGLACFAPSLEQTLAFNRDDEVLFLSPGDSKPSVLAKGNNASLHPNGKAVAFLASGPKAGDTKSVVLISTDKKTKRTVYQSAFPLRHLSFSRNGRLLFLVLKDGKEELLCLQPANGGALSISTRIPKPFEADALFSPRWCPDGKSVLFHDLSRVFRVRLDGQVLQKWSVQQLTGKANSVDSLCAFCLNPANPKQMIYTSAVKGTAKFEEAMGGEPNTALFLIDLASKRRTRLTPIDMVCTDPAWSRDGKTIYFCGYREPHYRQAYPFRIYSIKPDGSSLTEITKGKKPHP